MPSWDTQHFFLPLLDQHAAIEPGARVLDLGFYDLLSPPWAARRAGLVLALRSSIDLVSALSSRVREAALSNVEVRLADSLDPAETGTFDAALVLAPYFLGNVPVRQALATAASSLRPSGTLYFQVHRRHGGETFVRYARELMADVELLGSGGGGRRLYRALRPLPAANMAEGAPLAPGHAPAQVSEHVQLHEVIHGPATVSLRLAAGVFAARGVDPGSRLLLRTVEVPRGARILDLGCGAGTLGLALAAADPSASVVLVDSSQPAVALAEENAARNALRNVELRLSDGYDAVAGERFDAIVSNLPAHRGHRAESEVAHRFLARAPEHLRREGVAWFVANKALLYELPASRAFRQVLVAAADARYKVLRYTEPTIPHAAGGRPAAPRRAGR